MKKLFAACCITLCLLFSSAAISVRADDGDGHDVGYHCTETVNCPPDNPLIQPPPPDLPSDSTTDEAITAEDTFLTLLELIIRLLP